MLAVVLMGLVLCVQDSTTRSVPTAPQEAIARARALYNQQNYDGAIAAAEAALDSRATADAARVVRGRAYLERFRRESQVADLQLARDHLVAVDPKRLNLRERQEFIVGIGETLYLDDAFGASAQVFASVLDEADLPADVRENVLDWWATAREREAQFWSEVERRKVYQEIHLRMERELGRDEGSASALYWLASSARGMGRPDRAWNAAIAGWVQARLTRDGGEALRTDLDRLVLDGIIPDRLRSLPASERNSEQALAGMRAEWAFVKEKWSTR